MNLYRHFDKDGRLLYVGVSLNALNRLSQHRDASHWFVDIKTVKIEIFADRKAALVAEREAIAKENPLHNLKRPTFKEVKAAETVQNSNTALLRRLVQFNPTYSLGEAGNALGVSGDTVRKWTDAGEIGFIQFGRRRRITGWQLIEFLETTTQKSSTQASMATHTPTHTPTHPRQAACFEPEQTTLNRASGLNANGSRSYGA